MKKKYIFITIAVLLLLILGFIFISSTEKESNKEIVTTVKKGKFIVTITTTGELQAERSVKIFGPSSLRKVRVYNVKITDIVPEGMLVDSGDYVASLDRSEVTSRLKDLEEQLDEMESNYVTKQLDTTLTLRNQRDMLINLKFELEEKELALKQAKYEPPATIKQKEIDLDRAKRQYRQNQENYKLKEQQAKTNMYQAELYIQSQRKEIQEIMDILKEFEIKAPSPGMIIYRKEREGGKRKVGSSISPWDNIVATLPDFSSMVSRTYINEIDFNKVKVGQKVEIGIDAFPDKKYSGEIINLANIGEQAINSDAKVFEIIVKLDRTDTIIRPSMTTSNTIFVAAYDSVLYVPLETIHYTDSGNYVFKKSPLRRHFVITGDVNENNIIIKKGLEEGEEILLSVPEKPEEITFSNLEVVKEIAAEKQKAKEEAEKKAKETKRENRKFKAERGNENTEQKIINKAMKKEMRRMEKRSNKSKRRKGKNKQMK